MKEKLEHDCVDEQLDRILDTAIKINLRKGVKQAISFINKEAAKLQKIIEEKQYDIK